MMRHITDTDPRGPVGQPRLRWRLTLLLLCTVAYGAWYSRAAAQGAAGEVGGTLPDGTQYLMKVPVNWNGTLIRDLDYASGANNPRWAALLERGYALAGTGRHRHAQAPDTLLQRNAPCDWPGNLADL